VERYEDAEAPRDDLSAGPVEEVRQLRKSRCVLIFQRLQERARANEQPDMIEA
jgi:hypothetical protein